jgi:signal transduction histidine kinase
MLERIEALVATISRVSDNIAHELRTPLSRLRAELEELAEADDPEVARERSLAALDEAQRLQAMFEALLRIARLESGPGAELERLDLGAILADAAELHLPSAEDRGQRLEAKIAPDLHVRGDRDLIFQMVSNLLDNAVKFAPEGGHVRLAGRREGADVLVVVEDDGPGVKLEDRKRVFERFYRAADAGEAQGFGLGLSLVSAAASRHGASIRLEDAGPGLRVSVRFPGPDHQRPAL